jgi:hypothetical protein
MIGNDVVQAYKNADHRYSMNYKSISAQNQPGPAAVDVSYFNFCSPEVTEPAEQCGYKGYDYKKMTQLPGSEIFTNELCIQVGYD